MPIVLKFNRDLGLKNSIFAYVLDIILRLFFIFFPQIEISCFLGVYYYQDMNVLRIKSSD